MSWSDLSASALSSERELQRPVTVRSECVLPHDNDEGLHQRTLEGRVPLQTICAFGEKSFLNWEKTHWNNSREGCYFEDFYSNPGTQKNN